MEKAVKNFGAMKAPARSSPVSLMNCLLFLLFEDFFICLHSFASQRSDCPSADGCNSPLNISVGPKSVITHCIRSRFAEITYLEIIQHLNLCILTCVYKLVGEFLDGQ